MKPQIKLIVSVGLLLLCFAIFALFIKESSSHPISIKAPANILDVDANTSTESEVSDSAATSTYTISQVTRHAKDFVNQNIRVEGYVLKKEKDYAIFSDDADGLISTFNLPVTGTDIDSVEPYIKYQLEGTFVFGGLKSSNGNEYHLETTNIVAR